MPELVPAAHASIGSRLVDEQLQPRAIAKNGPLAGDQDLPRYDHDSEGRWPSPVTWTKGPGRDERHVYVINGIAVGPTTGAPSYRFERTLDPDEPDPPEGRTKPPKPPS